MASFYSKATQKAHKYRYFFEFSIKNSRFCLYIEEKIKKIIKKT